MSRTEAHIPFWVAANRAAKADPYNHIEHDHAAYLKRTWTRVEVQYKVTEKVPYKVHILPRPDGTFFEWTNYYYKTTTKVKTVPVLASCERIEASCNYHEFTPTGVKWEPHSCEPAWTWPGRGHRKHWVGTWGRSSVDDRRHRQGGFRGRLRDENIRIKNLYNSGEDVDDENGFSDYDRSVSWWW